MPLEYASDEQLDRYIDSHIDPEPENLRRLNRRAQIQLLYGRMCSGHLQGRLLTMLTRMIAPHRVLEIGAYAGYSALCLAEGLPEGGEVHTVEIDDELEDFIRQGFAESPYGGRVTLHIGDAMSIVPQLDGEWDLVFIDGNKRGYVEYYNMVMPRLVKGGYIFADNTLWDGKVVDLKANRDAQTRGVAEFNDLVAADPAVERVILPLRDGLTIIRKK